MKRAVSRLLSLVFLFTFTLGGLGDPSARGGSDVPYSSEWRTGGPTGGDVRSLVVDPNDPDRFYFGTLDSQIYISTDAGQNWRLLAKLNLQRLFVDQIIVDPRNSKVLYVATHRHTDPGGFFKSTDAGRTWREAPDLKNEALHSLTQSDSNPNILLAGTISGIFRSQDSGETWIRLPTSTTPGLDDVASLAIDPRNPNVIYAGTFHLPYKSTDGGQSWRVINKGMIDDSEVFAISLDPRNPNHIFMSACSGIYETSDAGENWHKAQGIPSQSRRTRAIRQHPTIPGLVFAGTTEGFWRSAKGGDNSSWMVTTSRQLEINSIAVHPRNPNTVYIGTNNYGVMVSTDAGKNFVTTNRGFSGRFVYRILPDRENASRVYATTINTTTGGGFFFVSNDGGASWQASMRNMPPRLIGYSILQDERDANVIYLGTNLGLYRTADRGGSWAPVSKPPAAPARKSPGVRKRFNGPSAQARSRPATKGGPGSNSTSSTPPESATVKPTADVVRQAQEALRRAGYEIGTPDGQAGPRTVGAIKRFQSDRYLPATGQLDETTLAALGVSASPTSSLGSAHVAVLSEPINEVVSFSHGGERSGMLAATNSGIYRTFDLTSGWERLDYGHGLDVRTTCISTSAQNSSLILVGTATSGVLISRDAGETWQQVSGFPITSPVNVVVQDPQHSAVIYAGTKQAFYRSQDGGNHWSRRGGNLPFGDFTSILINPRNTREVFVGNAYQNDQNGDVGGGVYRSNDGGTTWVRIDAREDRLPSLRIWALAFDHRDPNTLFVGSHSAGAYVVPRGAEASLNDQR